MAEVVGCGVWPRPFLLGGLVCSVAWAWE